MILLALTTSTDRGGLALFDKKSGKLIGKKYWARKAQQSENCTVELSKLLKLKKIAINNISDVLLDVGPGSFTGCRISASIAKTLGQSLNIPIHTVESLALIDYQTQRSAQSPQVKKTSRISQNWVLMDAHKSLFYFWNRGKKNIELLSENQVLEKFVKNGRNTIFGIHSPAVMARFKNIDSAKLNFQFSKKVSENFPLAETLGQLFMTNPSSFKTLDWRSVEPLYIRVPDAVEKIRKN